MSRRYLLPWGFLAALVLLLPAASESVADTIFPNPLFEMMYSPRALRLVDLNADGNLDMIAAGLRIGGNSSLLMIRLGNGDSTFGPASTFSVGDTAIFIASADLNEDGNLDLVVVNSISNDLSVLLGNGQGSFAPETRLAVGNWPQSVAIADVNEDGHLDLISADRNGGGVSLLMGDGTGSFAAPVSLSAGNAPTAVAAGDLDADGHVDLVISNFYSNDLSVKLGKGDGTFVERTAVVTSVKPTNVSIADVNSDSIPDLIVDADSEVAVHLGSGNGHFLAPATIPVMGLLAVGRFDGNATLDLLLLDGNQVTVFPGVGDGTFLPALVTDLGFEGSFMAVGTGDIDGDGATDFISGVEYTRAVGVFLGNGDGTFPEFTQIPPGARSFAVDTFNGDAFADLVVSSNYLYFLEGNGDGTFGEPVQIPSSSGSTYVVAGDLNGDGDLDVASVGWGCQCVSAFLGDGQGGFVLAGTSSVGAYPARAAMGDFDEDGNLDLVVTNGADADVSMLLGHGDGTFAPQTRIPVGGISPGGIVVTDLDHDTVQDIAVADWIGGLSLFFGNGDGTFQPEDLLETAITRHAPLVVTDFNADGNEDLAVGGQGLGAMIEVYLGQGDGTFQPPALYRVPGPNGYLSDLAVGDFNGDGIKDLASGDADNMVSIFSGVGDGRLVPEIAVLAPGTVDAMASGDFNGDGVDDLAVGPSSGGGMTIFLSRAASAGPCQDSDGDGFGMPGDLSCSAGALPDCEDSNANISPLAVDVCDGIDENCDGLDGTDIDADGYTPCTGDCDETNISVHPGRTESCNGIDDDCDGVIDVPAEVGKDLTFSAAGDTLSWSVAPPSTSAYNVYRGPLGPGPFALDQACFVSALTTPQATDTDPIPVPDQGYYYLVSGSNNCGEGTLGFLSDAQERPNLVPCP